MAKGSKIGSMYFSVGGDLAPLDKSLDSAKSKAKSAGKTMSSAMDKAKSGAVALGAAVGVAAAGIYALNKVMNEARALANIQEKEERKLEAVLKATGHAAGFSAQELKNLASQYQSVTTTGDEVILSGMSILATFKNVREEGFERATMSALDMSEVMGTSLNSSMTMLGKALNDPIKGLSALTRVGVTFSDQQREQVKALQKSGKMYEAQNIILEEMESQFGGVAKAMADLQGGSLKQLSNTWGDVLEKIGQTETQNQDLTDSYKELNEALEDQANNIASLFEGYGDGKAFFVDLLTSVVNMADDVQLMNIALIDGFVEGWVSVKYGGKEAALTLTSAFGVAGDEILEAWARMIDGMAESLDSMSFTITNPFGDDWQIGFDSATAAMKGHADNLRGASTATEDYREASAALVSEKEHELQIHNATIDSMVDEVLGLSQTITQKDELTGSTKELSSALVEEKDNWQAIAKAKYDGMQVGSTDVFMGAQAADNRAEEAMKAMEDEAKAAQDLAADRASAYRDMFGDMEHSATENFNHQLGLLNLQREEYNALKLDQLKIDEWYNAAVSDLDDERLLKTGDFFDGMRLGYEQLLDDQITWAEAGQEIFTTFADESREALSSNLFDAMQGDFDNLGDAWESLWQTMLKTLTDIIAEMVVAWAAAKVADVASAFIFHDGKWDVGDTFLGNRGLAADEVPAVLQMGEMVIPRDDAERIRQGLDGNSSIDASGFDGLVEAANSQGIDMGNFGGHLASEFGKDATLGAGYVASGGNVGAVLGGITSPANLASNITNALVDTVLDELGIDPTAQNIGGLLGHVGAAAAGLPGIAGSVAGLAASVGIDGLIDTFDVRALESIKDEVEANLGHFAGRMAFSDFNDTISDKQHMIENVPGLDEGQSNLDGYSDMPDSDDLGDTPGMARYGGVFDGPDSGYDMVLHNKEAVIPMPNGNSIPVEIRGGGNNSSQNIYIELPIHLDGKVIDTISRKMVVVADTHIVDRAVAGVPETQRVAH